MGRRKGSLNKSTLAKMGLDKYKIDHINVGQKPKITTQNVGNELPKKRVRRTREQLLADGYYDNDKDNKKDKKGKIKDNAHLFNKGSKTANQVSDDYIQKAKERGDENWEQDFRNDYEQGQKIYYVEINEICHTKELLELYVGTVYSKVMICWIERGESHSIGIQDADKIFREEKEAKKYYQKVRVK